MIEKLQYGHSGTGKEVDSRVDLQAWLPAVGHLQHGRNRFILQVCTFQSISKPESKQYASRPWTCRQDVCRCQKPKVRLMYALTANADGSEKLPPFVIGKAFKPQAFKRKTGEQLSFYYCNNAKAWITGDLYGEWIKSWDQELIEKGCKVILLQDNCSGHIVPKGLQNILMINFEPNLTAHVQPNDQGIIQCFKGHYRAKYILHAIEQYDSGITPSDIYDINQLQAMRLADAAWKEVDTTTIRNCWHKSGILSSGMDVLSAPSAPSIPVASLLHTEPVPIETQVQNALDELVATGALQPHNRMDIESLLNPVNESDVMDESTDQEIYEAVMSAVKACDNMEINGGDDVDEECLATIDPAPTHKDVLWATSVIKQYIDDINNPVACQLEALLGSFNCQLRLEEVDSLKDTSITDYFTSK